MGQLGGSFNTRRKLRTGGASDGSFNRWSARYTSRPSRTRWFFADGCWATKADDHSWDVFQPVGDGAQFLHERLDILELMKVQAQHGFKERLTGVSYGSDDDPMG